MSKRNLRGFRYEQLEHRRLLAADFAIEVMNCQMEPETIEQCEVAPAETFAEDDCLSAINLGDASIESLPTEETGSEMETEVVDETMATETDPVVGETETVEEELESDPIVDSETETDLEAETEIIPNTESEPQTETETEIAIETETEIDDAVETDAVVEAAAAIELGDPTEATLGHFGDLNVESMSETLSFTSSEHGMIDIAIAGSSEDSTLQLELTDSLGNVVEDFTQESVGNFQMLSFESVEGEAYSLTLSHDEACDDFFMVTVGFEEIPEPVDFHVDEMGEASTQLEFVDNRSELQGELEIAGDIDTFRFTADNSGKASLNINEMLAENATELNVTVYDADGNAISRGVTNETAMISFDVVEGAEYFVAVNAASDQVGQYQLRLEVTALEPEIVDDHANEIGAEATVLLIESGVATATGELESTEDQDAFRFASPIDGEAVVTVAATSEDHASDAIVSVFDDGELVVAGTTNQDVAIRFDVADGDEYQLLVDSLNDVPTSYELTATMIANVDNTGEAEENINEIESETSIPLPGSEATIDDMDPIGNEDVLADDLDSLCQLPSQQDEAVSIAEVIEQWMNDEEGSHDIFNMNWFV